MPRLKRPRQELFVQNLIKGAKNGISQRQAYIDAGYDARGDSADAQASRLVSSEKVKARMDEVTAPIVKKTRVSQETLVAQFDAVFDAALVEKQLGAAGNAAGLKAKLLGFMRERVEVGAVGEFDGCTTREETMQRLRQRAADDDIDDLRRQRNTLGEMLTIVEDEIAQRAQDVTPVDDRPPSRRAGGWPARSW